jgi:DNA-binding transcriptional ArsR family regulator
VAVDTPGSLAGAAAVAERFGSRRIVGYRPGVAITYRFGREDLLRTRLAISPLFELVGSLDALRDPARFAVHAPWVAWAAPRLEGVDIALLDAAVPLEARWYPDFVSPPPRVPHASLGAELERVRTTDPALVVAEMRRAYGEDVPPAGRPLVDDPRRALVRLARQMRTYWDLVLAPWWERLLALLEAEIAWRARRLAAEGPGEALAGLHPGIRWDGETLVVPRRTRLTVELAGRGLLLVPAAFAWPDPWPMVDEPWQPAVVYAPEGVATLWEPEDADAGAGVDGLLGARRAEILRRLARAASTAELAAALGASPAGVSEHLAVLRRAGLVTARRAGRQVLYARTAAGDTLLAAAARAARPPG